MTTKCLGFFCFAFILIAVRDAEGRKEAEFLPEFITHYNRGLELSISKNYLSAVEAFKKAIQIAPNCEEAYHALGRVCLIDLAKTTEAIEAFQTVIKLAPTNVRAHQMLGIAYFKRNAYQKAIQALLRAIELGPKVQDDYHHPYYDLGLVYLRQSKFDNAIRCFERAIQLNPDHIPAYYNLGNAYIRGGNVEKGTEQIKKYQALKPYADSVTQLEISVQRVPEIPELWYQLGLAHAQYDRFERAIKPLEKSIALNPNNREAYNALAACYMRLNRFGKMQQACKTSVRLAPNEASAHNNLGMSYFLHGKYPEAMNAFLTAIRLDEENPKFHQNLGKMYERLGATEKATHEFRVARQLQTKQETQEE